MAADISRADPGERYRIVILGAVCVAALLLFLGSRALWDIDEGMHAATAKEMILTGDWITPRHNGEPFYDKPPLFNWLTAASLTAFGFNEFAARLPAALAAIGCVAVTYLLGRRMFDSRTAFLGAAILATSAGFIVLARSVMYDMVLALPVTASLYLFYTGLEDGSRDPSAAGRGRPATWRFPAAYAAAGAAVLAKGPLGLVLPGLVVGSYLLVQRRLGSIRRMQVWLGALIVLAVAAPWYVAVAIQDERFVEYFFLKQNLGNFFSSEATHPRPVYYYVPVVLALLFPWSLFLPTAIVHAFRERGRHLTPAMRYLLLWCGTMFVFFTLARSKLPPYLLPMMPAAALVIGRALADALESPARPLHRGFVLPAAGMAVVAAAAAALAWWPDLGAGRYGITLGHLYVLVAIVAAGTLAAIVPLLARRYWWFFGSIVVTAIAFVLAFVLVIAPLIDPYRSSKCFAERIDAMLPPGAPIPTFLREKDSLLFYTNRKALVLRSNDELKRFLESDADALCLIDRRNLQWVEESLRDRLVVVHEEANKQIVRAYFGL